MKIVNVIGGLGNQMFQVAFAIVLREKYPDEEVLIDTQLFRFPIIKSFKGVNFYHNGFEVNEIFPNATLPIASFRQIIKVSYYIPNYFLNRIFRRVIPKRNSEYNQKGSFTYDSEVYGIQSDCYFDGYWQHYKYFEGMRNVLVNAFQFPMPSERNRAMARQMEEKPSVGIHVRRGDYIGNPGFGGVCTLEYYKKALDVLEVSPACMFYVFSNEVAWCEENLEPLMGNVIYVDWNKGKDSPWDMYLMSHCQQLIIANSSFSWWGAYLNQHASKIIAPKVWNKRIKDMHIQMPEWTLIG